jgi:hypothetical protein
LKAEHRLKLDIFLQGKFEPIQAQTKKALVNPFSTIYQRCVVRSNHLQTLSDHPNVSQASGDQQAAEAGRVSQVTFVNVKASAFLVREEGFKGLSMLVTRKIGSS